VRVELRDLITTRLEITTDTSDGTIIVSGTDSGVAYPTHGYAHFALFYNGSTDEVALDLNGTRILGWQDIGLTSFSSIDNIRFYRIGAVTGDVLFDDVSVQTIPIDVQAWWRFEHNNSSRAYEETGRFKPETFITQSGGGWEAAPEALYTLFNGEDGVRNRHARKSSNLNTIDQDVNIDLGTSWTLEFIASIPETPAVCTFFEWTTIYPPESTTGAWIKIGYEKSTQRIFAYLRDDAETGAAGFYTLGEGQVPNDDQWHHFAITKQNATIQCYIDYRYLGSWTLYSEASGAYSFSSNCYAYVGQSSSNTWLANLGIKLDEIRISDHVDLLNFLRIDHPRFTQMKVNAPSTALTFFAPPWGLSAIHHRTDMLSGTWATSGSFAAPTNYLGEERSVNVTKPSSGRGFYKIQ